MHTFTVIDYFSWGDLKLDKGSTILVEDLGKNELGNETSVVSLEHYPEKKQMVSTQAVYSMEQLNKIKRLSR